MRPWLIRIGIVVVCALLSYFFYLYYMSEITPDAPVSSVTTVSKPTQTTISAPSLPSADAYKTSVVTVGGKTIHVQIADTAALQQLGLGFRDGLSEGYGMLFVFVRDAKYAFWMKDMHFSIDMIWIAADHTVVYIAPNVSPDTYPQSFGPSTPARYVLEVPAGFAASNGLKIGDVAQF